MEHDSLYKKRFIIGIGDVDFTKALKLSTLFDYFQDAASYAAQRLGLGIDKLEKYSVTWVLLRMRVDIDRLPVWNEEITVETWPQPPKKIEFERDFIVRDKDGNVLIRAVSTWAIIDIKTRELQRAELISIECPSYISQRAIECRPGKIKPCGQLEIAYKKTIGYSDIDFNGHLNNSRYIDYVMDCFPVESHKKYRVKSIEINYVNEAFPGDSLLLCKDIPAEDTNQIYIEGVNEKDGKPAFKTRVEVIERQG